MNRKQKIERLLFELYKLYPSPKWHIYDVGNDNFYLFYDQTEIFHFKKFSTSVDAVIKFIKLCIIDSPESFGIKKIVCQIKKK